MADTTVGIQGEDFTINGGLTYAGREFEGQRIEGLLFNLRTVQAIFDDSNPATRTRWVYPDTGRWDPERNVSEFIAALPEWRAHGVLGFTVNIQGGGAIYDDDVLNGYQNSGFNPDGTLKPAYAERLRRVIMAADELGMVVILGFFYVAHLNKLNGEETLFPAAVNAMQFIADGGFTNVLVEIANEINICHMKSEWETWTQPNQAEFITRLRKEFPGYLMSTSFGGIDLDSNEGMPEPALIEAVDFLMPHGNLATADVLDRSLQAIRTMPAWIANPKPILINEDSVGIPNMDVSWRQHVSWGYYDQGFGSHHNYLDVYLDMREGERETDYAALSGYQTPPVNWGINTPHKRAFFERVAEVTGAK